MRFLPLVFAFAAARRPASYIPQCFSAVDPKACIFHEYVGGKEFSWNLQGICASADNEPVAWLDGCSPAVFDAGGWGTLNPSDNQKCTDKYLAKSLLKNIIFNVCGTVNKPIAPVDCGGLQVNFENCKQQPPPLPHARGVALQYQNYLDETDPAYKAMGPVCVNMETCDQGTNYDGNKMTVCGLQTGDASTWTLVPSSFAGTPNYPPPDSSTVNPISQSFLTDDERVKNCPSPNAQGYCSTKGTYCTAQAEILAYYDEGSIQPTFNLYNSGDANGGINITFLGALPYNTDSFKCTDIDPGTGYPVERSLNIFIGCDKNAKGLNVIDYTERGQCQYYITAKSAAACGASGDPYNGIYFPRDMAGLFFGTILLIVPFCYVVWKYCDYRGWLEPVKRFIPDVSPYLPDWLSGRGGVYGGGSYKFVSSASSGATATTSGAAISSSAYGST